MWSGSEQWTQCPLNGRGGIGVVKSRPTLGGGLIGPQWRHQNRLFSANVVLSGRTHKSSRRGKEGGGDPVRERVKQLLILTIMIKHFFGKKFEEKLRGSLIGSYIYNRVQWFWLFFTFWGITTHPWHPKGPRIWKLAKKIFNFIHGLRKFLAKTRNWVFIVWFQSIILGAPFDRSLPFF